MICKQCAWEADLPRKFPKLDTARTFKVIKGTSKRKLRVGHAACEGCDCQHKEPGAWNGGR